MHIKPQHEMLSNVMRLGIALTHTDSGTKEIEMDLRPARRK